MSKSSKNIKTLVVIAMMIALEVVLSRFLSIPIGTTLKFGFNFVPICVAAYLYGPVASLIVGAVGDFLGAVMFPTNTIFYGFTLTAALTGLIFGIFLNKKYGFFRILLSVLVVQIALTIFLDSLWFNIYYGSPYTVMLVTRAVKAGVMVVVQCVTLNLILPIMSRIRRQLKL